MTYSEWCKQNDITSLLSRKNPHITVMTKHQYWFSNKSGLVFALANHLAGEVYVECIANMSHELLENISLVHVHT